MAKNNINQTHNKNATKKALVIGSEGKNRTTLFLAIAAIVVIAGGMVAYNVLSTTSQPAVAPVASSSTAAPEAIVTYAASDFADGKARHFQHTVGNVTVKYFILKSSDGVIRAAFDACDVCWPSGKGYYQDGDVMVCRNCGRRFASVNVNEVAGGCNPAPLNRRMQGDKVVIQVKDIIAGKNYFTFT